MKKIYKSVWELEIKVGKINSLNASYLQFNYTIIIASSRTGPKQTTGNEIKINIKWGIIYWDADIFRYKKAYFGEDAICSSEFHADRFNLFVPG